jgi:hypothetical protein
MAKTSATPLAAASAMNGTTIRLIQEAVVMFVVAVMMFVRRPDRWPASIIQNFPAKRYRLRQGAAAPEGVSDSAR